MKKSTPFSVFVFFLFFSCQVQEEISCKPMSVDHPPVGNSGSDRAYIELKDLQTVEYVGNFLTKNFFTYEDKEGNVFTDHYLVYGDVYKIKASRYWDWFDFKEYISSYKEEYEISARILSKVRERVKNMGAAICSKRVVTGEDDHIGVSLEITDVIQ